VSLIAKNRIDREKERENSREKEKEHFSVKQKDPQNQVPTFVYARDSQTLKDFIDFTQIPKESAIVRSVSQTPPQIQTQTQKSNQIFQINQKNDTSLNLCKVFENHQKENKQQKI
jgi:hypothetical protein